MRTLCSLVIVGASQAVSDTVRLVGDALDDLDDGALNLLQLQIKLSTVQSLTGAGCNNAADGYTCVATSIGTGRGTKVMFPECNGAADQWACTVDGATKACDASETCKSFGVSAKWGLNKAQLFTDLTTKANPDWSMWVVAPDVPEVDEASAVGDPHMTSISGENTELCCQDGHCKPCPALFQTMEEQKGAGCDNAADGYTCVATSVGTGRGTKVMFPECNGAADQWACTVDGTKKACDASETCKSFGVSAKWGLNKAQLFTDLTTKANPDWSMWVVAPDVPEVDEASAVGDPHLTSTSGEKTELCCQDGHCKPCPV